MSAPTAASHTLPLRNCYWVVPGLLLAGEHPNGPTRDKTKERLKKLMAAGIECFVDLTKPTELLRYDTLLPFYVEYTRKAIKDHGVPSARSQMIEILEHIATSLRAGRPVYVHCRAGIGRTGTVVGCFLAERGLQGNAVIDELNRLWQQCRRSRSWPFIPETDAQAHYVRDWQPGLADGFDLSSLATAVATVGPMTAEGAIRGGVADSAGVAGRAAIVGQGTGAAGLTARAEQAGVAGRAGAAGRVDGAPGSAAGLARAAGAATVSQRAAAGLTVRAGDAGSTARAATAGNTGGVSQGARAVGLTTRAGDVGTTGAAARAQTGPAARPPAGGGLRAAAEQARAAVARGEVQVKAPPVPTSTAGPASPPVTRRSRPATPSNAAESRRVDPLEQTAELGDTADAPGVGRTADDSGSHIDSAARAGRSPADSRGNTAPRSDRIPADPRGDAATRRDHVPADSHVDTASRVDRNVPGRYVELERGEISPSIRAEIAAAMGERDPSPFGTGTRTSTATGAGAGAIAGFMSGAEAASPFSALGTAAPNVGEEAPWAHAGGETLGGNRGPTAPAPASGAGMWGTAGGDAATSAEPSIGARTARTAVGSDGPSPAATVAPTAASSSSASTAGTGAPSAVGSGTTLTPATAAPLAAGSGITPTAGTRAPSAVGAGAPPATGSGTTNSFADSPDSAPNGRRPSDVGSGGQPAATQTPPGNQRSIDTPPPATYQLPAGGEIDPLLDPDTLAAARGLRERFVGCLFGLAVGDAVAAATQFRRPGTFSPVGDMLGGGPFDLPRGAWSDDTAMGLCLAESLLERDGFDARDQVQRYSRWQQDGYLSSTGQCVGISASTARSLALAKWRRGLVFPGSHDPEQLDPEPLSRIASIALFYFSSLDSTLLQAVDSARITCQAPAVLDACRRLARALNAALSGQPKTKILAEAGPLSEAAAQTNNSAASALAAAFWAFSSTDNFREAVLRAANVGGNSDVVTAVCGQLAGAYYGATAIPQPWRSGLIQKDLIEGYADRLLAHALVSLSG